LSLAVNLPQDLPSVMADSERLQQVLNNLIHNAIKFTPPGGRITVTARTGNKVTIAVSDTGVGIAADDLTRIFERFYKADRARSGGGTGLGLAIAKHIVQAHGGQIWAESTPGLGATFSFTLPVAGIR
jgi:two-component system phosphate regulon sensor histidine kinase PhoR